MAQKEHTIFYCDYDGQEIPANAPHVTRTLMLDAVAYESDLCEACNDKFETAVTPFLGRRIPPAAHRRSPAPARRRGTSRPPSGWRTGGADRSEIRGWARQRGYKVSDFGRIPVRIVAEYEAAH